MNRSLLFWLLLLLLWLIFTWWCCTTYLCGVGPVAAAPVETCDTSLKARDGNFSEKSDYNLRFLRSQYNNLDYGSPVANVLKKTADYLSKNPERSLTVTGTYESDETNSSILPNLGLARANKVKSILTSLGAPSKQINTAARIDTSACYSYDQRSKEDRNRLLGNSNASGRNGINRIDTLDSGISLAFGALTVADDRIKDIYDRLRAEPMTVYFDTNAESLNLNAQQKQDVADIRYYLDNVDGSMIEISGHTDNVGNQAYNVNLSKERAEFVKDYFNRNAELSNSQMEAAGYGPNKPKTSNATAEGKAQNRRVEVTFK